MKTSVTKARLRSGLVLVIVACLFTTAAVSAHDPGLSTLDVVVRGRSVSVTLSMSAPDAALVLQTPHGDVRTRLQTLARDSIHLAFDDRALSPGGSEVAMIDGGARVHVSFELPIAEASSTNRLSIASEIPQRLARGHRELLTVKDVRGVCTDRLLDAASDPVAVDLAGAPGWMSRVSSFVVLGIHHILTGYDHLVFLAGLMLAACTFRQLLVALTAFTAAHSLSLALVVIAGIRAPSSVVEPLIAASIAWVGVENLLRHRQGTRWIVVFAFGLIHGFGFADALIELGFGTSLADVATALISFNGGVEIGQVAAAAAMLPLVWMIRWRPAWQSRLVPACSILITVAGGYWLFERLS